MIIRFATATLMILALAVPASAVPYCQSGGRPGISYSFGLKIGRMTQNEIDQFNLMQLRRLGVDASSVEEWNGCIRAYVRKPGGGEEMQFFEPDTFQRVY